MLKRSFILTMVLFWIFSFSSCARLAPHYKMSEEAEVTMTFNLHTVDNGILSDALWEDFVDEKIAPVLPDGFIISSADKYIVEDDELFKWPVKIVTVVMMNNKKNLARISEINKAYEALSGRTAQVHVERTLLYFLQQ